MMKHCSPKHKIIVRAAGRMEHCTQKHRVRVRTDIGPTLTLRWAKAEHEC